MTPAVRARIQLAAAYLDDALVMLTQAATTGQPMETDAVVPILLELRSMQKDLVAMIQENV